jgi:hypothetical protein
MQKLDGQKGLFVDRGVGSSMLPKSASACSLASGFSFGSAKVSIVYLLLLIVGKNCRKLMARFGNV